MLSNRTFIAVTVKHLINLISSVPTLNYDFFFEKLLSGPLSFSVPAVFRSFPSSLFARFSARSPLPKAFQSLAIN